MKLKMKKFFAALGALAIVGMVAVGCQGKNTPDNKPTDDGSITVKQSGKEVTALTLNVGDKVEITTNAASAADGALVVVAKPSNFTVTSSDAKVVAASNTALEAKATGNAKVTFAVGKAKVEVAVTVEDGGERIKNENYYGIVSEDGQKKDIYIPSTLPFSQMSKWEPIVKKAMSANGLDWEVWDLKEDAQNVFGFRAPKESKQHYFSGVLYTHSGVKLLNVNVFSGYGLLSKNPADADELITKFKDSGVLKKYAEMFGNFKEIDKQECTVEPNWTDTDLNFGQGAKKFKVKKMHQLFLDPARNIILLYRWEVVKDMAPYNAKFAGIPAVNEELFLFENADAQSMLKSLKMVNGDFSSNHIAIFRK